MANNTDEQNKLYNRTFIILTILGLLGIIAAILLDFFNFYLKVYDFATLKSFTYTAETLNGLYADDKVAFTDSLGVILLIIGASYIMGSILGFLFGVPKINANIPPVNLNAPPKPEDTGNKGIIQNDNLVQISDWLTKIIVGASLVSLSKIPGFLVKLFNYFSNTMHWNTFFSVGIEAAIFLYIGLGLISGYLWARIKFFNILKTEE